MFIIIIIVIIIIILIIVIIIIMIGRDPDVLCMQCRNNSVHNFLPFYKYVRIFSN